MFTDLWTDSDNVVRAGNELFVTKFVLFVQEWFVNKVQLCARSQFAVYRFNIASMVLQSFPSTWPPHDTLLKHSVLCGKTGHCFRPAGNSSYVAAEDSLAWQDFALKYDTVQTGSYRSFVPLNNYWKALTSAISCKLLLRKQWRHKHVCKWSVQQCASWEAGSCVAGQEYLETSVSDYPLKRGHTPEERHPQHHSLLHTKLSLFSMSSLSSLASLLRWSSSVRSRSTSGS